MSIEIIHNAPRRRKATNQTIMNLTPIAIEAKYCDLPGTPAGGRCCIVAMFGHPIDGLRRMMVAVEGGGCLIVEEGRVTILDMIRAGCDLLTAREVIRMLSDTPTLSTQLQLGEEKQCPEGQTI
jgi:hypothetical protein